MALGGTFRVAIFDEFLTAFAALQRAQQKKVNKFIRRFKKDPTASSINYEKISTFTDQNLRTVRIDQAYRAIVLAPEQGNVYVLLWVDHHDKAMAWAENKQVQIHPETGALQVLIGETIEVGPPPEQKAEAPPLFESIRDRELTRLGVPDALLPQVREIRTAEQLDDLQPVLPAEAYEALFFLAEGESLAEVERSLAQSTPDEVDTEDFAAALEREDSLRRFVVVDDDEALEAMLDAPLDKWRIFLHPSQRKLVHRSWNGPVRVLGGAGTGKTVVAMHRAAYLAEKVFTAVTDRLLFTTFTRNLALDIHENLRTLASPAALKRIEVVHLDKWVADLLKRAGYAYSTAYWNDKSGRLKSLWGSAMALANTDFDEGFYRDEWNLVVQPLGCATWNDYRRASRAGRGTRISRQQRKAIWPVFEEYRNLLDENRLREPEGAIRDALQLLKSGAVRADYRSILVDEAQDMTTGAFELLRAVRPEGADDMFIVGDGHQRIYRRKVVLSHAGVHIVGRAHRLRINYRTTDEIRRFAVALLEGLEVDDLDGEMDTTRGYKSLMHGAPPAVEVRDAFDAEVEAIVEWIREGKPSGTCLVARTRNLRDRYETALRRAGFETYPIKRGDVEDPKQPGVRLATMHRVKGLEFDRMVVAGVNAQLVPYKLALEETSDHAVRADVEARERSLLYVAVTRARRGVLITAHDAPSAWLVAAGAGG